jgi:hypothetical protein
MVAIDKYIRLIIAVTPVVLCFMKLRQETIGIVLLNFYTLKH